jgi:hypothetical protein
MKNVLLGSALVLGLAVSCFAQQIPRQAGTWTAQTLDGKTLNLNQYKGKYVVLAFLLTT